MNTQNNNPDFKNRFKQKYAENRDTFGSEPLPIVKSAMKYAPSGEALDLGAGNGRNTLFLLSRSFKVTSVDSSEEGLKILEERAVDTKRLKTILSDVRTFQTENKYDVVLSIGLLHFISKEEGANLIKNMQKWTKTGGINVIGVKMTQNFAEDLPHVFEKNELRKYYEKNDWEIKEYAENRVAFLIAKKLKENKNE
jgi:tellurite methyltransferase